MNRSISPPHATRCTRPAVLAALSLGLISLLACAGDKAVPLPTASARPGPSAAMTQIDALIGSAPCTQQDQCRSIGIGARACGGPQSFRAWSSAHTDTKALTQAVSKHRQQQQRAIERSGEMSTCQVLPDPGARCVQLRPDVAGGCELGATPGHNATLR